MGIEAAAALPTQLVGLVRGAVHDAGLPVTAAQDRVLLASVNLMLTPAVGLAFAVAGMTSAAGRCHTFES